ncbi:hypothetical protein [Saccharothrix sp. ST-888]|uniref:hypothetical protein n=1 Tax=Saccharothrix sp. ST-888 TaxID=1427391 RepID=UPI0006986CA1|nr:hypothetical protein [Saccharothrix sp. ST-888]
MRRLDLVLLHHSLQFAPARWKELRGRLGRGRRQSVQLPDPDHPHDLPVDHRARHYRENRDLFHEHLHAGTLFMTGSAKAFRETTRNFLDIARHGPGHVRSHPNHPHFCTEFHSNDGILGRAREIHVEYCDRWDPPR